MSFLKNKNTKRLFLGTALTMVGSMGSSLANAGETTPEHDVATTEVSWEEVIIPAQQSNKTKSSQPATIRLTNEPQEEYMSLEETQKQVTLEVISSSSADASAAPIIVNKVAPLPKIKAFNIAGEPLQNDNVVPHTKPVVAPDDSTNTHVIWEEVITKDKPANTPAVIKTNDKAPHTKPTTEPNKNTGPSLSTEAKKALLKAFESGETVSLVGALNETNNNVQKYKRPPTVEGFNVTATLIPAVSKPEKHNTIISFTEEVTPHTEQHRKDTTSPQENKSDDIYQACPQLGKSEGKIKTTSISGAAKFVPPSRPDLIIQGEIPEKTTNSLNVLENSQMILTEYHKAKIKAAKKYEQISQAIRKLKKIKSGKDFYIVVASTGGSPKTAQELANAIKKAIKNGANVIINTIYAHSAALRISAAGSLRISESNSLIHETRIIQRGTGKHLTQQNYQPTDKNYTELEQENTTRAKHLTNISQRVLGHKKGMTLSCAWALAKEVKGKKTGTSLNGIQKLQLGLSDIAIDHYTGQVSFRDGDNRALSTMRHFVEFEKKPTKSIHIAAVRLPSSGRS